MSILKNPSSIQKNTSFFVLPYILPRLVEGKVWFIVFYAKNPDSGQLCRFRIKFNRIHLIKQRREAARSTMEEIAKKLQGGWNPFITEDKRKSYTKISYAIKEYVKYQYKIAEKNSMRSYICFANYLSRWINNKGYSSDFKVNQFSTNMAADILEELRNNPNVSYRTYNNYLAFFRAIWNWFIDYNYASANPFSKFKKFPKKLYIKTRLPFSEDDRKALMQLLLKQNLNYLCICYLCYYCLLRPKEISFLKVKDIDLYKQTIFIRAEIAKNDRDSIRTIPDAALEVLKNMKLATAEPDDYLFSWDNVYEFTPGKKHLDSREISRYWNVHVRRPLGWGIDKQFYNLKGTGITNMVTDGMAPNAVQSQADHTSLSITSIYLRKTPAIQQQIKTMAKPFDKD